SNARRFITHCITTKGATRTDGSHARTADGVQFHPATWIRGRGRQPPSRGHDAPGNGGRRDRALARSACCRQPGVSRDHFAVASHDPPRHAGQWPGHHRSGRGSVLSGSCVSAGLLSSHQRERQQPGVGYVSVLCHSVRSRGGDECTGGIVGYPLEQLQQEVAFIAYYFHWSLNEILDLQHPDRRGWVEEISAINRHLREEVASDVGVWSP